MPETEHCSLKDETNFLVLLDKKKIKKITKVETLCPNILGLSQSWVQSGYR